jgi:hypothetical protein
LNQRKQNGELLVNLPFWRRRELVESLLGAPKDPLWLSPHCRRNPVKFLRQCANSAGKVSWVSGSIIASVANITEVSLSERKPTRIQGESVFFSFHRF